MRFCVVFASLGFVLGFSAPQYEEVAIPQNSLLAVPTHSEAVARGTDTKHCPPTYELLGKLCVKIVTVSAVPKCQVGSQLTQEGLCATYVGKRAECPEGFERLGNGCERRQTAQPTLFCTTGYTLSESNECTAPVQPTPTSQCVNGSIRRGDLCIIETEEEPKLSCPAKYELEGKKCRIEELYNCTPTRADEPTGAPPIAVAPMAAPPIAVAPMAAPPIAVSPMAAPPVTVSALAAVPTFTLTSIASMPRTSSFASPPPIQPVIPKMPRTQAAVEMNFMRRGFPTWRRNQARQPVSKEFRPELTDYVLEATCKRIRRIPAEKVCDHGILNGKMCRVDSAVPPVEIASFSTENDIRLPELRCPDGFSILSRAMCVLSETRNILFVCPENTQDIGDRCVTYTSPTMTCPPQFALESSHNSCIQNLETLPITEYTVKYQCSGKDCANNQ